MKNKFSLYLIIPSYAYYFFEIWLSKMSRKGWQLISYRGVRYTFLQNPPRNVSYFIYHCSGFRTDDGKFSLQSRYWNILACFGLPVGKSKLNSYTKKHFSHISIIEIEPAKLNTEAYRELLCDRKKLYFLETLRDNILIIIASATLSIISRDGGLLTNFWGVVLIFASLNTVMGLTFFIAETVHHKTEDGSKPLKK